MVLGCKCPEGGGQLKNVSSANGTLLALAYTKTNHIVLGVEKLALGGKPTLVKSVSATIDLRNGLQT